MLSGSNSLISTDWRNFILAVSLAGIGGKLKANEKARAGSEACAIGREGSGAVWAAMGVVPKQIVGGVTWVVSGSPLHGGEQTDKGEQASTTRGLIQQGWTCNVSKSK